MGVNLSQIVGSSVAVPVDIQFHDISSAAPIPVVAGQSKTTIANADAVRDTTEHYYYLTTHGGMLEADIRQHKEFKISIRSTLDSVGTVMVWTAVPALGNLEVASPGLMYKEIGVLPSSGILLLGSAAGGTGCSANYKVIPSLKSVHSNLCVSVSFPVAPTTGVLTIVIEGVK